MNVDDLAAEWKEMDMSNLSLAVDTGKLAEGSRMSMWLIWAMTALMTAFSAMSLLTFLIHPNWATLGMFVFMGVWTVPCYVFERRQRNGLAAAEDLLQGPPADLVRGRISLLQMERRAWRGPVALGFSVGGVVTCIGLLVAAWALGGPLWLPLGMLAALVAFVGYGWRVRLPRLAEEIDELTDLEETLRA